MEQSGGNIATRVGDGNAYVWNWNGVNNTLNRLYQKDIYESKYRKSAFDKSLLELQKASEGVRPQDIPSITNHFNTWKNAETMLLDPKVRNNPELRSKLQAVSNEAHTNYMAETTDSKDFKKEFPQYKMKMYEDKGHNYDIEGLPAWENQVNQLSTKEIRQKGLDVPTHLILGNDSHDPDKFDKTVFGTRIIKNFELPGEIDKESGLPKEYIQTAHELPAHDDADVAHRVANEIGNNKVLQRQAVREFQSTDPTIVKQTVAAAKSIISQHPQNGQIGAENTLSDNDPYSFQIAKAIIKNQPKVLEEVSRRPNHELDRWQIRQEQARDNARQERHFGMMYNQGERRLRLAEQSAADKHAKFINTSQGSIDTDMIYNSLHNPDQTFDIGGGQTKKGEAIADAGINAIASDVKNGVKPFLITKSNILNPKERFRIGEKLGLELATSFGGDLNNQEVIDDFVKKYNEKFPDQRIKSSTLNNNKGVLSLLSTNTKSTPTGKIGKDGQPEYVHETIKSAKTLDPTDLSPEELRRELSQVSAAKRKDQKANEVKIYNENLRGGKSQPPVHSSDHTPGKKKPAKDYGL